MVFKGKTICKHQGFQSDVVVWRHCISTCDYLIFGTYTPEYFNAEEARFTYLCYSTFFGQDRLTLLFSRPVGAKLGSFFKWGSVAWAKGSFQPIFSKIWLNMVVDCTDKLSSYCLHYYFIQLVMYPLILYEEYS